MLPANIVLENGVLNDALILKREFLYQGMNGRFVERFFLSPAVSFIFKPLTNNGQLGREVWVHQHILPQFPAIYPKIISYRISEQPEWNWMIVEDLGALNHDFSEKSALEVSKWVAWWHSLPIEKIKDVPIPNLKPQMDTIAAEVGCSKDAFLQRLPALGLDRQPIEQVYTLLGKINFSTRLVLSHGDLHLGNFSLVDNQLKILDWEHSHLNSPYWDLYHLIDMSHPLFPKQVTSELRQQILEIYLNQVDFEVERDLFMKEYYLFSAVFSMWMIGLIEKDLQAKERKWPEEQLHRQMKETIVSLKQCAEAL
ncbi:phosphotransferase [Bacillus sp. ISL-18]|uniref:phosphotransferase n=1 Tax=Bacillus sp. ISL-18 TaxID=2819118 RepID=UPI001BEA47CA|nr:phosphotransferase [Bacillus sp. ISL-18]MBT2657673.1 phosphotransferase [Bacillus sp. ISL-18]